MVDIKNKIIYFGYGDVAVGSDFSNMEFINVKSPQEVGSNLNDLDDIDFGSSLKVYEDNPWELKEVFETVSESNMIVKYKDFTFDFTNFNQESIEVCIKQAINTVWMR